MNADSSIEKKSNRSLEALFKVMEKLLAPEGCPWDREQTPQTLARFVIEEAHELAEALDNKDVEHTKEELGDVLFQVVFHATLAKNLNLFSFEDVVQGICEKLIRRHPHVFGDLKVSGTAEVLKNWDQIKENEKGQTKDKADFRIPLGLAALQRAQKIGEKTKSLKFDWASSDEVLNKVDEELGELKEALKFKHATAHVEEELGDLFFVLAQLARHLGFDAEGVARGANRKFERRFKSLLQLATIKKLDFETLSHGQKEILWQEVKGAEPKL